MTSDLFVFLRWQNVHGTARYRFADRIFRRPVSRRVEADAEPRQAATNRRSRLDIILSNAASEHEQIDSAERRDHRGRLLAHGIAEHRNGKSCIGV